MADNTKEKKNEIKLKIDEKKKKKIIFGAVCATVIFVVKYITYMFGQKRGLLTVFFILFL